MIDMLKRKRTLEKNSETEDICVLCGKKTDYSKDTPVEKRFGYIRGAGQLCPQCYREIYPQCISD